MNLQFLSARTSTLFAGLLLAASVAACAPTPAVVSPTAVPPATAAPGPTAAPPPAAAPTATAAPAQAALPTAVPAATAAPTVAPAAPAAPTAAPAQAAAKINLNTASQADFMKVPGVGNNMVREFLEYRPYTSVQQFNREIGKYVNAAQVAEYLKYVYVPVVVNEADAATLQQIPGVDAKLAAALIAARPFAGNDAFLTKLGESLSPAQVAAAKGYLKN